MERGRWIDGGNIYYVCIHTYDIFLFRLRTETMIIGNSANCFQWITDNFDIQKYFDISDLCIYWDVSRVVYAIFKCKFYSALILN